MSKISNQIIQKLNCNLNIDHIELINESHKHNVADDSESHFKLFVVSDDFNGLSSLKRHKVIYSILKVELKHIHALSITAFNKEEYESGSAIIKTPECANKK